MTEQEVFPVLGEEGFARIVAGFYRRVKTDDLIGPMYPGDDWEGAEVRLKDFLIFRFGGSEKYIEERGHPRLRMRHMPYTIGIAERDRWVELMCDAMDEAEVSDDVRSVLAPFFAQTADFMRNSHG